MRASKKLEPQKVPEGPPAPVWSGQVRHAWMRLPQKTTLILVFLLMVVVTCVGGIFFFSTRSMLQSSQQAQVSTFAYGVAATLGEAGANQSVMQIEFSALDKTPNLDFVVLTDMTGQQVAAFINDHAAWEEYQGKVLLRDGRPVNQYSEGHQYPHSPDGTHSSYALTVPVFRVGDKGQPSGMLGYLHTSFSTDGVAAQLKFLQAFVLFTCMGVVLLVVPVAGLIARHITVPISRLATGAHALADGDLSHRVPVGRGDELGELAAAFNRMADTVQQQQSDIQQINEDLEKKVHQRTAELEKVNTRLQSEISEKEDFLRAVSHDLNAPLRNIAGMASMLAIKYADTLEKDALQRLDRIQKNVQVECELINELLELSRIKSRREKIEHVDLHDLMLTVSEAFQNDLETRGISLKLLSHLPPMRCEKMRMRQVFQNLVDNAIKYMRQDGPKEIRVGCRIEPDELVFSFEDTGMGIAKDEVPNLFHVFRRAKNAAAMKVPGKGVGLASVKSIVENYNGRLWVESIQGQGTTFFMALPLAHFEFTQEEVPA